MKLLVLGGVKFIGRELIKQALKNNHDITVISLDPPHYLNEINWLKINRNDYDNLNSLLKNQYFDCVIDNIALSPGQVENFLPIIRDKTKRYLLTSSVDTYGHNKLAYADEKIHENLLTSESQAIRPYVRAKRSVEKELRKDNSDLEKVIVRPARVFGAFDNVNISNTSVPRSLFWYTKVLDNGPIILENIDTGFFNLAFVKDVASALLFLSEHPDAVNEVFNLADDKIYTNQSFIEKIIDSVQSKSQIIRMDKQTMIEEGLLDNSSEWLASWGINNSRRVHLFDNNKLKSLGWQSTDDRDKFLSVIEENIEKIHSLQKEYQEKRNLEIAIANRYVKSINNRITGFFQGQIQPVAIGTFKGDENDQTDEKYRDALGYVLQKNINVVDTAINYRNQLSEKVIGKTITELINQNKISRQQVYIITKGGYIPKNHNYKVYQKQPIRHSIKPDYIQWSLNASRDNLNLDTIDLFLLHNPELELKKTKKNDFYRNLTTVFAFLENEVDQNRIRSYGLATWSGLIAHPSEPQFLDLNQILYCAELAAGKYRKHRFSSLELPLNSKINFAVTRKNQTLNGKSVSVLEYAREKNLQVFTSNSVLYGDDSDDTRSILNFSSNFTTAQKNLLFVKSVPGVTSAIVGMKKLSNVKYALEVLKSEKLNPETVEKIIKICKFKTFE